MDEEKKEEANDDPNKEQKTIMNSTLTELPKDKITITVDTLSKLQVKVNQNVINENYMKTI